MKLNHLTGMEIDRVASLACGQEGEAEGQPFIYDLSGFDRKEGLRRDFLFMIGLIVCAFPNDIRRAFHHSEMHSC